VVLGFIKTTYYPFGMISRSVFTSSLGLGYRYGFNGKESDDDVKGAGDQIDYGMRVYDPRLGRFLSNDPLTEKYPQLTPYQYASNCPISGNDMDGLEFFPRFKQNDPLSLTSWSIAKRYQNSPVDKVLSGTVHGYATSLKNTGNFIVRDAWKSSTWKNVGAFFEEGILDMSTVKVAQTPLIDAKVQEFKDKVLNGDAYSRSSYFAEFGTNMLTGALLDKGLGELSSLKVFTNTGNTFQSTSIRFTQNTINDFAAAVNKVASGKYEAIDIVKMGDGIYSTVDNTRLLAAQKLGLNIKATVHAFGDALPEGMQNRFKSNATGSYAKTWGEAIEFRTGNQSGGFSEQHGSNGTFIQPEIRSH
jgi:RHS repeat-associated protein